VGAFLSHADNPEVLLAHNSQDKSYNTSFIPQWGKQSKMPKFVFRAFHARRCSLKFSWYANIKQQALGKLKYL